MADFQFNLDMLVDQKRLDAAQAPKPSFATQQPKEAFAQTLRAHLASPQRAVPAPPPALPPLRLNKRLENFVSAPPVYRPSAPQSQPVYRHFQALQSAPPLSQTSEASAAAVPTYEALAPRPQALPGQIGYQSAATTQATTQAAAQPSQTARTSQAEQPAAPEAAQQPSLFVAFALPALAKPVTQAPFGLNSSTKTAAPEVSEAPKGETPDLGDFFALPVFVVRPPAQPAATSSAAAAQATPAQPVLAQTQEQTQENGESFFPIWFPLFAPVPEAETEVSGPEFAPVLTPFEPEASPPAPVFSFSFVQFQAFESNGPEPQLMLIPLATEPRPLEDWIMTLLEAGQFTAELENPVSARPTSFFGAPPTEAQDQEDLLADLGLSELDETVESDAAPGMSLRDIVQLPPEVIQRLDLSLLLMMQTDDESVWPEDASFWQNMLKTQPLSVRPRFSAGKSGSDAVPVEAPKALNLSIWVLLPKVSAQDPGQAGMEADVTITLDAPVFTAPVAGTTEDSAGSDTEQSPSQEDASDSEKQPKESPAAAPVIPVQAVFAPVAPAQPAPVVSSDAPSPEIQPAASAAPAVNPAPVTTPVTAPAASVPAPVSVTPATVAPAQPPVAGQPPVQTAPAPQPVVPTALPVPAASVPAPTPAQPASVSAPAPVAAAPAPPTAPAAAPVQPVVVAQAPAAPAQPVVVAQAPAAPAQPVVVAQAPAAPAQPVVVAQAPATPAQPVFVAQTPATPAQPQPSLQLLGLPQGTLEMHPHEAAVQQAPAAPQFARQSAPAPLLNHLELKIGHIHVRPVDAPRNEQPAYGRLSLAGQRIQSDLVQAPQTQTDSDGNQKEDSGQREAAQQPTFAPVVPRQEAPAAVPFKLDVLPQAPRPQAAAPLATAPAAPAAPALSPSSTQEAQPDFSNYLCHDSSQTLKQVERFVSRLAAEPTQAAEAPRAARSTAAEGASAASAPAAPVVAMTASQVIQAVNSGVPIQISDFPAFVNAVVQKLDPGSRIIQSFEVTLSPDNMGQVTAQFGLTNQNRVVITLYAQTAVTAETLETYQQEIKQIVDKTQLSLGSLTVKQAIPASRQSTSQGGTSFSSNQQGGTGAAAESSSRHSRRNKKRRGGEENLSIDVTV